MLTYILPDQLDPKVVSHSDLPTVSGQIPTWNQTEEEYVAQMPFTNEFLGKPLSEHPTVSGQVMRWDGSYWRPISTSSLAGPVIKKAVKVGRQTINSKTPVKLAGMSITMPVEAGEILEVTGIIGIINGSTCTPWIGYTVDDGTKIGLAVIGKTSGWWANLPIETMITGLSAGNHTIDIWGASDGTTYIEAGTSAWYTYYSQVSEFAVIRIKSQT